MKFKLAFQAGKLALALVLPVAAVSAEGTVAERVQQCWTQSDWEDFYSRDQGSRIMPFKWILALKQPKTEQGFMEDTLSRYGYLPNEGSYPALPVGFNLAKMKNDKGDEEEYIGMTCAACHTRQIKIGGQSYRIDGGPAIVDFQHFVIDLKEAMGKVIDGGIKGVAFNAFAKEVLGNEFPNGKDDLWVEINGWYEPYKILIARSLPNEEGISWGPGRLDAVSMIFNRLAGLDIGPAEQNYIIEENIQPATAPVRYPFLWNATKQDKTQWAGFAPNGNQITGLARNLGEVYGVFGAFHPQIQKRPWYVRWTIGWFLPPKINYLHHNSANFSGLLALEELTKKLCPPKWPWEVDQQKVIVGKSLYNEHCANCHGIKSGDTRFFMQPTWATPVQDVNTDCRQWEDVLDREVNTGVLKGARILLGQALKKPDKAINVLTTSVIGTIIQYEAGKILDDKEQSSVSEVQKNKYKETPFVANMSLITGISVSDGCNHNAPYEARVLEGIWAAAPYLHNASVPTLYDLLKPAEERPESFPVGTAYDKENVGIAKTQEKSSYMLETTGCSDRNSGDSRCGHEYGTRLTESEKMALIEYLKTL